MRKAVRLSIALRSNTLDVIRNVEFSSGWDYVHGSQVGFTDAGRGNGFIRMKFDGMPIKFLF
jgi:hypothetical protein